eukprot:SAG31_NODE_22056_length_535_cov_0.692661_1_plen_100_part_10
MQTAANTAANTLTCMHTSSTRPDNIVLPRIAQHGEAISASPVEVTLSSYVASRRLLYGGQDKITAESLEDETNPMIDGCDFNGGDGRRTEDIVGEDRDEG